MRLVPGRLDRPAQETLLAEIRDVVKAAPLFMPRMPRSGKPFSVRMTNCGALGWVSDERGYRYQATHPETGAPWPQIPALPARPVGGACRPSARSRGLSRELLRARGSHGAAPGPGRERISTAPVLSVSLGDTCLFRDRRDAAARPDALVPPRFGRRHASRRREPPRLPRSRPAPARHVDAPEERWSDQSHAAPCHHTLRPVKGAEDGRHGAGSGARPTMPSQVEANTQLLFSSEDAPCDVRSQAGPHESSRGS